MKTAMNTERPRVGFSQLSAQQRSNMMSNLRHRTEIATTRHNHQLLQLLTDERSQLEKNRNKSLLSSARWSGATQLWQHIVAKLSHRSQLSVERRIATTGEEWWYVKDPRSGKTFHAESFDVAMHWIEENRLGRS